MALQHLLERPGLVVMVMPAWGRGLLVSSEARDAMGLRAPADVMNLLAVWGLPRERGAEA